MKEKQMRQSESIYKLFICFASLPIVSQSLDHKEQKCFGPWTFKLPNTDVFVGKTLIKMGGEV